MKKITIFILLFVLAFSGLWSENTGGIKRFVLAAGTNDGGHKREKLRYAVSDAKAFISVLTNMGGVNHADAYLLVEPEKEELTRAITELENKILNAKKDHRKTELIFYYSGHSDEEGLMLSEEKLLYETIRKNITELSADVKVAILDSCSSGALIREKGGKMSSSFLIDSANDMKGYAFITSSSEDEVSQESDKIKSSFFTHYLISGLRGAADMTGDGRVSLNEAYQYAYNETLGRTQKTMGGAQHAGYYIKMSGTGDVVITEIQKSDARLDIEKGLQGIFTIRNDENTLIAEMKKKENQRIQIGIDAGDYHVFNQRGADVYEASVTIQSGSSVSLMPENFSKSQREFTFSRGDNLSGYHTIPVNTQVFPVYSEFYETAVCKFTLSLFGSYCGRLDGISAGAGVDIIHSDVKGTQASAIGNITGGKTDGVQGSSIFNLNGSDFKGVQGAGTFNVSRGNFNGTQGAGLFNVNGENFKGVQGAGLFTVNGGDFTGVQGAGLFALNKNNFKGVLGSGLFTVNGGSIKGVHGGGLFVVNAENIEGIQGGGLFSLNGANVQGVQGSGLFNKNGNDLRGVQGSGLFNINNGTLQGVQGSAFFNYTKKNQGLQAGLINYAGSADGLALGLINMTAEDGFDVLVWSDNQSVLNAGVKFNYNYTYSIIYRGLSYKIGDYKAIAIGYLFGVHVPVVWGIYIDGDFGLLAAFSKNHLSNEIKIADNFISEYKAQARLSVGYKIIAGLSAYTGFGFYSKPYSQTPDFFYNLDKMTKNDLNALFFFGAGYNINWK